MKMLTEAELVSAVPVMSRRERLFRWAQLIRASRYPMHLVHDLEHWHLSQLAMQLPPGTPFGVAAANPLLQQAGLTGSSVNEISKFFELSRHDLHEFSCDCGGQINNYDMAARIERLA